MKIFTKFAYLLTVIWLLSACSEDSAVQDQLAIESQDPATTIYTNGDIITVNAAQPNVEAVAVRDGKIFAVGDHPGVMALSGDNVILRDLQGGTLIPGLIDAHGHLTMTARNQAAVNVSSPPVGDVKNIDDLLGRLNQALAEKGGGSWLIGWGYDDSLLAEQRHPTRADLDRVSTENPIALIHVSGHFIACNSKCLELGGVTAQSEDLAGGVIRRVAGSREPNGVLEELAAMWPVYMAMPQPTETQFVGLLGPAQQYYASFGITTVQEGATRPEELKILKSAAAANKLYLDVVAYVYLQIPGVTLEDVTPSARYQNHFRVGGIKLVLDGSPQGKTAWLSKPYLHPPHGQTQGYAGYGTLTDDQAIELVSSAFEKNVPVLAHANGDAAADQFIGAVKAASVVHGVADRRPVMIHAQTVREDQLDAMQELGMLPSYFSAHTFFWGDWHRDSVFGEPRASRISPLKTTADRGMPFTTHNDTPIVPPDMMRLLWASVNRITRSGKILGEAQRVSPLEALESMTIHAAYQYFEEDSKGSIEVGKLADLVILDHNPLTVDPIAIKDIVVLETIKSGTTIYSRP
ncbi:MAG: putative amidohydrolase YtcJ [Halieaceae bacterium]|jgi:predicted amidohydrolase YtcJ